MGNTRTCAQFIYSGGQGANATTDIAVPWNSQEFLDGIYEHDIALNNSQIKVKNDGKYLVMGCINYWGSTGNYRHTTRISFRVNGATILAPKFTCSYIRATSGSNYSGVPFNVILDLNAGDYFEVLSKRISTTSGNATVTSGTHLSIMRVF